MSEDYYKTLIKDIIENSDKEEAIKIIANKLKKKQISNEKEMLTNLDKDKEIERLNKRNKEIYEGFMATTKELTEYAEEVERLNNIIKEVREYIEKNWISQKDADNYRFDDTELIIEISDIAVLFDILDKGKE